MPRVRAAVVGVGYLGRFHAMKYRALPDVDLVGVVDIRRDRAEQVAQELDAEAHEHHRAIIGKVDVVTVAVPTTEHHLVARQLMKEGIHVLVEKPICASLEEAEDLVDTAKRSGVILQVGHLERFNPVVQALKKRLNAPLFLECHRISPYPGRGADVDVVLDLMIHDIDLLLDFLKAEVVRVDAVGVPILTSRYDIVNARFQFAGGCVANVTASRVSAKSLRKIRVFQRDAYLSVDCNKGELLEYRKLPAEQLGQLPRIVGERLEVAESDTLLEEVRSFVDIVRGGGKAIVDGVMGMRCLEVALKVIHGIEETVPEDLLDVLRTQQEDA
jgi:predicted dehydrogenase